jgi:uroporphyrin-III C-methyltransferase
MITDKINTKLTLVGAGPGDPELITLKGLNALKTAKVVLYDALIAKELLEYAPNALKIFVGKRKGFHKFPQDEINKLIVDYSLSIGDVVRLKGGDPFIFGRGSEEVDYAEAFGIETLVIPGITSSISVPAYSGISLTKRNVAESFWVVTGTTSQLKLSKDVYFAAQSTATVVVLMGMSKLNAIVKIFQSFDKGTTPVSIIQNGTTNNERIGLGTIDSIEEVVARKKLSSPAVIVIGEVVRNSSKFREFYEEVNVNNQIAK